MTTGEHCLVEHAGVTHLPAVAKGISKQLTLQLMKPLAAYGWETPHAHSAMALLIMSHLQGFEDIGTLDEVASELMSSMETVDVNEEEALFEVNHSARRRCLFAEPQASSPALSMDRPE